MQLQLFQTTIQILINSPNLAKYRMNGEHGTSRKSTGKVGA